MTFNDMKIENTIIPGVILQTAWDEAFTKNDVGNLETYLEVNGLVPLSNKYRSDYWVKQEISNRLRQKARKAGLIKLEGKPRKWMNV